MKLTITKEFSTFNISDLYACITDDCSLSDGTTESGKRYSLYS